MRYSQAQVRTMSNNYTCPKPSCEGQRLNKVSGTRGHYMCFRCQDIYIVDTNGRVVKEGSENKKTTKYKNKLERIDGVYFQSKGEGNYYCQLKLRRQANDIKWFALQPRFILQDGEKRLNTGLTSLLQKMTAKFE